MSTRSTIAIIGGTGFGQSLVGGTPESVGTPYGPAQITRGTHGGVSIVFLARHGAGHSVPPHRIPHRANIHALKEFGADAVLATTAVGSLQVEKRPGDFLLPSDLLDMTKGEVVTFFDGEGGVRHTDMGAPYSDTVRQVLMETAPTDAPGTVHPRGTYVCVSGPRYETPAEVRLFAQWGGDVVGMTGAPEAVLCRELGLPYASVSLITNYGTGIAPGALSHADVEANMAAGRATLGAWLLRAVATFSETRK